MATPEDDQGRDRSRSSARSSRPIPPTTSAASTTATATSTASRRTRRPRRTRRSGSRSRTGAGPAFPSSSGPESGCRSPRRRSGSSSSIHRGSASPAFDRQVVPNQLVDQARPLDRRAARRSTRTARDGPGPIEFDMEFAAEGGEGADAVRGAPPRGDGRQTASLHPAGRRRGDVAGDAAAARQRRRRCTSMRPGSWGPEEGRRSSSPDTVAGTSPGSRHERDSSDEGDRRARPRRRRSPRSRTTRSCPTATRARSSRPTARSTGSAFHASTRRASSGACSTARPGRSGSAPYDINHPSARHYEPGTNVLVTTWKTPSGWVVVRDALTMGPTDHEDTITPHTRPPADDDAEHLLVRTVECLEGSVEMELLCEPLFDYGRVPAEWSLVDGGRHLADATGLGPDDPPRVGSRPRHRGDPRPGPPHASGRRAGVLRPLLGRGARHAGRRRRCGGEDRQHDTLLARVAGSRSHSGPSLPGPDPALGTHDQGLDLHAYGRDGRRADDVAAGDPGWGAQLGLPLHLDARHDVHAAGAALAEPRLGGRRVHAVRGRRRTDRGRLAADHVRDRRPP